MMQTVQCPKCGQANQVDSSQGELFRCSACGQNFRVAAPVAAQPVAGDPSQPGYVQYQTPVAVQKTSVTAILALVFGCLALLFPPAGIVAIVLGIIALTKTKNPQVGGKGLAIAGICVGTVGMIFMACMLSILLPSLNRARETANRVKCASNLRQLGQAMLMYANENRGVYPPTPELLLLTQDISADVFNCPSTNDTPPQGTTAAELAVSFGTPGNVSYIYFGKGLTTSSSPDAILFYETSVNHDGNGGNFLFGDGHVEFVLANTATKIIGELNAGHNPPRRSAMKAIPGGGL